MDVHDVYSQPRMHADKCQAKFVRFEYSNAIVSFAVLCPPCPPYRLCWRH